MSKSIGIGRQLIEKDEMEAETLRRDSQLLHFDAQAIVSWDIELILAGGVEIMTRLRMASDCLLH